VDGLIQQLVAVSFAMMVEVFCVYC